MKSRPTIDRLREVLRYNEHTGELFWQVTNSNAAPAGSVAGVSDDRYVRVSVDGRKMLAHRVIWAIVTGEWPALDVDHKDTDGLNNRWKNLREATMAQNIANSKISIANTSGFKGVTKSSNGKRWKAQIGHSLTGKPTHRYIGTFDTKEQASAAYVAEASVLFGEFARPK